MKIGIIGTGNVGSGLGKLWAKRGHEVMFGSREPEKAKELAAGIGHGAQGGSIADAAAFGEVILLSVPFEAAKACIDACGSTINGKVVLDCSNPMGKDRELSIGFTTSAAEEIAKYAANARVVKGLNTVSARTHESGDPLFNGQTPSVFFCGDDTGAKAKVSRLIQDAGYEPVDAGPLRSARLIEPFGNLLIRLAEGGMGSFIAPKLLRR